MISKITKVNWGPLENLTADLMGDVVDHMVPLIAQGITDGKPEVISIDPYITNRYWADDVSAQAYVDYLNNVLCPEHNIYPVSIIVIDYPET
jgi:hypothetical protein